MTSDKKKQKAITTKELWGIVGGRDRVSRT